MKRTYTYFISFITGTIWLFGGIVLHAQENLVESRPVAPAYYGPNAFPIPEMGFGRTCSELSLELGPALALHKGFDIKEDATVDAYFKLRIPLFTPRVNLVIWGEAYDWFHSGAAANATRGVEGACSGGKVGELFVSTDIHALRQEKHYVDLMVRAALKSAAGDFSQYRRYYDSPGYFFDVVLGREFAIGQNMAFRLAASAGFLCWQTGTHTQNDAPMYGIAAGFSYGCFDISAQYGGYVGWRKDGDSPMSIRVQAKLSVKQLDILMKYQEGLIDWPYRQISVGAAYRFDILRKKKS